ncbi:MAG: permease [Alphaproteobacteria bacterium]|jgi:hypothetical protein|nr:permease [Alphaproteobacteria bacterium]
MPLSVYLPQLQDSLIFFAVVSAEMTVLFIGVTFLVGIILELFPAERISAIMSSRRGHGYAVGAGLGALTPFCSCSTIPLTMGLIKARAGFGPTMTFLFTSPLVNPLLVALLWMALGIRFTIVYVAMALTLTVIIGYLLDRFDFDRFIRADLLVTKTSCGATPEATPPNDTMVRAAAARLFRDRARLKELLIDAVGQFRTFLPFIIVGIGIGAFTYGFVPQDFFASVAGSDSPWAIPASAVIGIPLYVRPSTMVPMVLPLAAKGVALGAIAALIIGAAGASLPEVVMLKRMFRLPMIAAFLTAVLTIAVTTGFVFQAVVA